MRSRNGWKRGCRMGSSAEKIKELVSIEDAALRYGLEPNRKGYISCPLHEESTPSLKLYPDTNSFYCFGCGAGGDVLALVRGLFGLNYGQAVVRLASDFGIVLNERRQDYRQASKIQQERAAKANALKQYRVEYMRNVACFYVLWTVRRLLAPKTREESLDPLFLQALHELPWLDYWLNEHPWR